MPHNKTNPNTNTLVTLQNPLQPIRLKDRKKPLFHQLPNHTQHMHAVLVLPEKPLLPIQQNTAHTNSNKKTCHHTQNPRAITKTCHHQVLTSTQPGDKTKINNILLRKEVIQPHLPVRLPCYDFVPIANPTFDHSPHQMVVRPWASGVTNFHDVTGGVYKARERIHRSIADLRLLATPTSWGRVADPNPN